MKSSAALMSSTDRCLLAPARLINAGSPELLTATREKIDCKYLKYCSNMDQALLKKMGDTWDDLKLVSLKSFQKSVL